MCPSGGGRSGSTCSFPSWPPEHSPPFIAATGLLLALVGVLVGSWWLAVPAGLAAVGALIVVVRLGLVRADLAAALGPDWADRIPTHRRARMVGRGWRGRLPTTPEPGLRQDVVFATVPGTGRKLLCDLWQPQLVCLLRGSPWSTCTAAPGACWTRTSGPGRCSVTWPPRATWWWMWPTGCSPRPTCPGWSPTPSGRWPG